MSSASSALSALLGTSSSSSSSTDLSSILQAVYGTSSVGIDVNAAVSAAVYAARAPERQWQAQQAVISSQQSALQSLNSATTGVENDLTALDSYTGTLSSMTASSSQPSIVSATAANATASGTHTVVVNNLASTGSWYSNQVSGGLSAGQFSIQVGSDSSTAQTITVTAGETLSQLASDINSKVSGVSASVVTDSTGSRLAIASTSSGAAGNISITPLTGTSNGQDLPTLAISSADSNGNTGLSLTEAAQGQDASITVDGVPFSSATNTVTGTLSGITLNLLSSAEGTPATITIAPNTTVIASAIQSFVNDYNTLVGQVNAQFTVNTTTNSDGSTSASQGPLSGDSVLEGFQSILLGAGAYQASDSTTLATLGITMNNDGTLSIDDATLSNMVQNNFSAVQNFFQGATDNGFANTLQTQLSNFTQSGSGAFTVDLSSLSSEYTDLTNQINDFETNYITSQQAIYQAEYSQAEIALESLAQTQSQLNALLGNNNNSNG
jgi:flagellar hook-associated protein 2